VKQRDDLISALRYAVMMRRYDKSLSDCDGVVRERPLRATGRRQQRRVGDREGRGSRPLRVNTMVEPPTVRKCRRLAAPPSFDADAWPLLRQLGDLLAFNWHWRALDLLWNFESENGIRARPAPIAVLLQELSSSNPVPRALAQQLRPLSSQSLPDCDFWEDGARKVYGKSLIFLATPAGIEPATFSLEGFRSLQQKQRKLILFGPEIQAFWPRFVPVDRYDRRSRPH
jgi:hypothetical protein